MPAGSPTPSMPFSASYYTLAKTALITGITGHDGSDLVKSVTVEDVLRK